MHLSEISRTRKFLGFLKIIFSCNLINASILPFPSQLRSNLTPLAVFLPFVCNFVNVRNFHLVFFSLSCISPLFLLPSCRLVPFSPLCCDRPTWHSYSNFVPLCRLSFCLWKSAWRHVHCILGTMTLLGQRPITFID